MLVTVDLKLWAIALSGCSVLCCLAIMLWSKRGSPVQRLSMILASAMVGPLTPILAILVLPIMLSNLWFNQLDKVEPSSR